MIVYNLIFWAACPSGAPHAPCKSFGVQFLWLAGLVFPHLLLTGSWLSREFVGEDSPRTVPPKTLQLSLVWTKCCSQGQAPVHMQFWQIGSGSSILPSPIRGTCVCAIPLFPGSGSFHPLVASPDALKKKAVQHSPQWISIIFLGYCSYLLVLCQGRDPVASFAATNSLFAANEK